MELQELSVRINEDQYDKLVVHQDEMGVVQARLADMADRQSMFLEKILDVLENLAGALINQYNQSRRDSKFAGLDALETDRENTPPGRLPGDESFLDKIKNNQEFQNFNKMFQKFAHELDSSINTLTRAVFGMLGIEAWGLIKGAVAKIWAVGKFLGRFSGILSKVFIGVFGGLMFLEGAINQWEKDADKGIWERAARSIVAAMQNMVSNIVFGMMDWVIEGGAWLLDKMGFEGAAAKLKKYAATQDMFDDFSSWLGSKQPGISSWLSDGLSAMGAGKSLDITVDRNKGRESSRGAIRGGPGGRGTYKTLSAEELEAGILSGKLTGRNAKHHVDNYEKYKKTQANEVSRAIANISIATNSNDPMERIPPSEAIMKIDQIMMETPEHIRSMPAITNTYETVMSTLEQKRYEQQLKHSPPVERNVVNSSRVTKTNIIGEGVQKAPEVSANIVAPVTQNNNVNNTTGYALPPGILLSPVDNDDGWLKGLLR